MKFGNFYSKFGMPKICSGNCRRILLADQLLPSCKAIERELSLTQFTASVVFCNITLYVPRSTQFVRSIVALYHQQTPIECRSCEYIPWPSFFCLVLPWSQFFLFFLSFGLSTTLEDSKVSLPIQHHERSIKPASIMITTI